MAKGGSTSTRPWWRPWWATGCGRRAAPALTPRERQILGEIAQGKSNAAIAAELVLTKRAVEKHVNAIFAKLSLRVADETVDRRVRAALLFLADGSPAARDD